MSKKSKKQRAKVRKAEVRRQSGITLRAVTPPAQGAKVLELKRAAPPEVATAEPVVAPAPFAPDTGPDDPPEAAEARHAIAPAKLEPAEANEANEGNEDAKRSDEPSPEAPFFEQRTSQRVSVAVDIHLSSESHFYSGLSGDISEGGLFVSTYRPLSVGSEVDVEFSLPGTERPVHARGEVRWIREHSAEQPRGVGIAFETLSDEDRDEIHSFCSSRPPLYYEDVG